MTLMLGSGAGRAASGDRYHRATMQGMPQAGPVALPGAAPSTDGRGRPATRVLLVRHAPTPDTGHVLTGRAPGVNLSDAGRRDAEALADRLAPVPIAAVYASPLERTSQTAAAVAARHGLGVVPLAGVLEADYGTWTGGRIAELARTELWALVQRHPSRVAFPDGESIRAMQERSVRAVEQVVDEHPGAAVVIVSHADPIKAVLAHYAGVHLDRFQRFVVAPASLSVLDVSPAGATLVRVNDTGTTADLVRSEPPATGPQPGPVPVAGGDGT